MAYIINFCVCLRRPSKEGFDIVIGNPPYGAKIDNNQKTIIKRNYTVANTSNGIKGSTDTFCVFIEKGFNLLRKDGVLTYIIPMSFTSSDAMGQVYRLLFGNCDTLKVSSFSNRPKQIFEDAGLRVSIISFAKTETPMKHLLTTKMMRRRKDEPMKQLMDNLQFVESLPYVLTARLPKVGSNNETQVLNKILELPHRVKDFFANDGKPLYYRAAGGRYFNVVTDYSTFTSAEKQLNLRYHRQIGLCLSSTLFWFYQQVYTDGLNLKQSEIKNFPLPNFDKMPKEILSVFNKLYSRYLEDIETKANRRIASGDSSYNVDSFKEYKIVRSKAIIDEIDDYICPLYGLTQEETDFIKNYELEFRLAGE